MDLKPHIFIGSSREGIHVAKMVKIELSDIADCTIWEDAEFEFGKSAYESLSKMINLYDYAILIATPDDTVVSRTIKFDNPRDNVIFEMGLYSGRLGRSRAILLREDGTKYLTDLSGITMPEYPKQSSPDFSTGLVARCDEIKKHIKKTESQFNLSLLPSTAIAHGYFHNFVEKAVTQLLKDGFIELSDKSKVEFTNLIFTVIIPSDLSADMFEQVNAKRHFNKWVGVKVNAGGFRPFDFHVDIDLSSSGTLHLYDVPLTLNSLYQTIQMYLEKAHLGKDEFEERLESREIRMFKKVIDYLVSRNPITRNIVRTEIELLN